MEKPATHAYSEIKEGTEITRDYVISRAVYEGFLATFSDRSPAHVNADFARARGFSDQVMHGAILNGFISHFVGMVFPGEHALLLSVDLRYAKPCYLGDALTLTAKVAQKVETHQVIVLNFNFHCALRGETVATGRAQVRVE